MKLRNKILSTMLVFLMALGTLVTNNTSYAAEENSNNEEVIQFFEDNKESIAQIKLPKNSSFTIDNYNDSYVMDNETNAKERLPKTAKDKNDNPVNLKYFKDEGNNLYIFAESAYQTRSVGKCITGISGGAIAAGTAGGLAGAGVGTVTIPIIGAVPGAVVGVVGGGVGGGLSGAAASCFD